MLAEFPHHLHLFRCLLSMRHTSSASSWQRLGPMFGVFAGGTTPAQRDSRARPVLVVDFNGHNGTWCKGMLSDLGHEVCLARDIAEVITMLGAFPWLLVFAGSLENAGFRIFLDSAHRLMLDN